MGTCGGWTPAYRPDRWVGERSAFRRWRATSTRRVWPPWRGRRFRRWLVEYRVYEADLVCRRLADERGERLAYPPRRSPVGVARCTTSFEVADSAS